MQNPVLYRGLGDHTFYNMYIYIFITYYMSFLYILPYPYCDSDSFHLPRACHYLVSYFCMSSITSVLILAILIAIVLF